MNKRRRSQAFDEREMILIKISVDSDEIRAHALVVRLYSSVAHDLPAGAQEWDVGSLRSEPDGKPFTHDVIVAWLNCAYQAAYGADYQHQPVNPASSVSGLCQLLCFADAVDSTDPLLRACVLDLNELTLTAKLDQQQLQLDSNRAYYILDNQLHHLVENNGHANGDPATSESATEHFCGQVADQTEQLLYLAYKLQLKALIKHLHTFIANQMRFTSSVLHRHLDAVFSDRALEQALGPNQLGRRMWIEAVVSGSSSGPLMAASQPELDILQPIGLTTQQKQPIRFSARLKRSLCGIAAGTTVQVHLDLFNKGKIVLAGVSHRVQLKFCPTGNLLSAELDV